MNRRVLVLSSIVAFLLPCAIFGSSFFLGPATGLKDVGGVVLVGAFFLVLYLIVMATLLAAVALRKRLLRRSAAVPKWPPKRITRMQRVLLAMPMLVLLPAWLFEPEVLSMATHLKHGTTVTVGSRRIHSPLTSVVSYPWRPGEPFSVADYPCLEMWEMKGLVRSRRVNPVTILGGPGENAVANFSDVPPAPDPRGHRRNPAEGAERSRIVFSAGRRMECFESSRYGEFRIVCRSAAPGDNFAAALTSTTFPFPGRARTASRDAAMFYRMLETAEPIR